MTRREILAIAKPILFNTEMMCANLSGRKTVTRRLIKLEKLPILTKWTYMPEQSNLYYARFADAGGTIRQIKKPYIGAGVVTGKGGDYIYARETWRGDGTIGYEYKADGMPHKQPHNMLQWRPSIHMPKAAARWFGRVLSAAPERLQDITEKQAKAEGVITNDAVKVSSYKYWFKELWDNTIPPKDRAHLSWAANPWVWVIAYEHITPD